MSQDPETRFSRDLERWSRKPPRLTPQQAAARIGQRLPAPGGGLPSWGLRLATAVVLVGAAGLWWIGRPSQPSPDTLSPVPAVVGEIETPPLGDDVAVFYLDAETPLYLTLAPPQPKKEPRS